MIRYFSATLAVFAFVVALALAQDKPAAPKKKAEKEPDKNEAKDPGAKKVEKDAKDPEAKKGEETHDIRDRG